MDISEKLLKELPERNIDSLPKGLYINEKSLPAIIDVLKYWSTPLPKTVRQFIRVNNTLESYDDLTESMMGADPEQQKQKAASMRNRKAGGDVYGDPVAEKTIYHRTWALLPPRPLLPRHPALAKLAKEYVSASDSLYKAAKREVVETWQVNPTIFVSTNYTSFAILETQLFTFKIRRINIPPNIRLSARATPILTGTISTPLLLRSLLKGSSAGALLHLVVVALILR